MILFKASSFGWFIQFIQLNQSASLLLLFKYDFINSSCLPEISSPTSDQHIDLLQEYSALRLQFSVWSVKINDNCFYFSSSSAFELRLFRPFLHFLFVSFLFGIWKFCASYFKRTIWPSLTTTCWSSSESEESMKSFADLSSKSKLVVSTSDRSIYCFQRLSKFWSHVYFASTFATRPYQALNNHEH